MNGRFNRYLRFKEGALPRRESELPTLRELEKDYIGYLLEITQFNVTLAARILDISRTALYHKIRRYGLSTPSLLKRDITAF
ncbi:MAG TPA: helix-turn-helix domain-containing protein [Candidatus Aminicenantes bacterium]|nr:helix-turn-helix domain-containing protein [Candidatus Aminicenantes bacterium]